MQHRNGAPGETVRRESSMNGSVPVARSTGASPPERESANVRRGERLHQLGKLTQRSEIDASAMPHGLSSLARACRGTSCSNRVSDASWTNLTRCEPNAVAMGRAGIEPATLGLKVPCSTS